MKASRMLGPGGHWRCQSFAIMSVVSDGRQRHSCIFTFVSLLFIAFREHSIWNPCCKFQLVAPSGYKETSYMQIIIVNNCISILKSYNWTFHMNTRLCFSLILYLIQAFSTCCPNWKSYWLSSHVRNSEPPRVHYRREYLLISSSSSKKDGRPSV